MARRMSRTGSGSVTRATSQTYKFDIFSSGFVSVLAAEQTEEGGNWFQGTADAVRQSLRHAPPAGCPLCPFTFPSLFVLRDHWRGQSFMAIGAADPVSGVKPMQSLRANIRGCPAPLVIEEAGHFVQEWGEQVAAALASFGDAAIR